MKIPKYLIFNFITRQSLNNTGVFGRRLNSMSLDFSFMIGIVFPIYIVSFIPIFLYTSFSEEPSLLFPLYIGIIPYTFITILIINKDFFKARSIAKRQFGYQIMDFKSNLPASKMQCVIRNSTMIIWPLEVLVSVFSPRKRLGDLIAGTILVDKEEEDPELIMEEIWQKQDFENNSRSLWLSVLVSLIFTFLCVLPILLMLF